MKKLFLAITAMMLLGCSKDEPVIEDPLAKLPPETQTGANTFGCIINGQVFYPRDCSSSTLNPGQKGVIFWGDPSGNREFNEIQITNCVTGIPASSMMIHLQGLHQQQLGDYIWQESNFQSSINGLMQNYVYARIYDSATNSYKYYSSYQNSGKVTITKYDNIISGNFSGKLRLYNGTDEIDIKSGRFDINSSTISSTSFP
ncbi:hypothetical protein B0A58_00555 [Flavobacterium branchiophilum NBRC 15030 = ATCC 35035]|uniref:Lipoprotein n=1 Tax=Flavobacterium branchiophilum TaxID=55197 RepID=A0A543G3W1_9FLAO|nr:hypothetical protein [Flavobacterium branchiophilum]OXA82209.1 hypothetical protein B0A58_00555 [Flavobacterium branchiophilum NBRC 15030 = ATCC 35035]TQM40768.1 hypothetical protein BC670_1678 [Flavobacterium branchiophilum]GEM55427.1 hypothetical protein FB1_16480 [Flavobacterium branchiophilum NBRC 15030 = ATCC 35035]